MKYQESLSNLASLCHATAVTSGWMNDTHHQQADAVTFNNLHSEVSELSDAIRHGNKPSDKISGFTAGEEEAADIMIRLLAYCHRKGFRIGDAILAKNDYNGNRPFRHGNLPW